MTKSINDYSLDQIAVAIEKRLEPKFTAIDNKFVTLEANLKAHTEETVNRVVDRAIDELGGMIGRGFNEVTQNFQVVNRRLSKLEKLHSLETA